MALAHFGGDATKAFELFGQSLDDVQTASQMLISLVGQQDTDQEFVNQMRGAIWAKYSTLRKHEDGVAKKIDDAVSLIENLCRPALEWKGAQ